MSPLSLLEAAWLPVRRTGSHTHIRPYELTADLQGDPIIDLDWPRADFRIACLEFLIGLLATLCPPKDRSAWIAWWRDPPTTEVLKAKFAPFIAAFMLDGPGPRFCQDTEEFPGESVPIERLLIDAPGENTVKRNTDLLVKRDRVPVLGRPAAAMALYTLQAFAPSGGAGHRTSLRGGGPLTTLVAPVSPIDRHPHTLWHLLWANVPHGTPPTAEELPLVFPWLANTRRSEGDVGTVLDSVHAHALQAFWGMPRRIRLDFRAAAPGEVCGLTGEPDAVVTTSFRTRPWGVRYVNSAHFHPLSPTYRTKPGEPPLAVHPQPDGIGYRHWGSLVGEGDKTDPAAAVTTFVRRAPLRDKSWSEARLVVGGYDMDNMKARAFIEAEMPFFVITDDQRRRSFLTFSRSMAQGATEVAGMLRMQLRIALTIDDSDRALVDSVRQRFFEITTEAFWRTLRIALARDAPASDDDHLTAVGDWLRTMRHHALALFDEVAPLDPLSPGAAGKIKDGKWVPPPVIAARRNLASGLSGYGPKSGEVLFATLGLELPEKRDKSKKRKGSPNG